MTSVPSSPPPAPDAPTGGRAQFWGRLVVSLLIGGLFVWLFHRGGLPLVPGPEARTTMRWWCAPAYFLVLAVSLLPRLYRWHFLLRPVGQVSPRQYMSIGLLGHGLLTLAPLRTGELIRPYLLARATSISFMQGVGTVAAERIIDGLIVTIFLLIGLVTNAPRDPLPDHLGTLPLPVAAIPHAAQGALVLFVSAFLAMAVFYVARDWARRLSLTILGPLSPSFARAITDRVDQMAQGLSFLPHLRHSVPFLLLTLAHWALGLAAYWLALVGTGLPATLGQVCVMISVTALGILIPSGPGMFGTYQLSTYCALSLYFPEASVLTAGAAFVFVTYSVQMALNILCLPLGELLRRHGLRSG